jgi:hypothetical protein
VPTWLGQAQKLAALVASVADRSTTQVGLRPSQPIECKPKLAINRVGRGCGISQALWKRLELPALHRVLRQSFFEQLGNALRLARVLAALLFFSCWQKLLVL